MLIFPLNFVSIFKTAQQVIFYLNFINFIL